MVFQKMILKVTLNLKINTKLNSIFYRITKLQLLKNIKFGVKKSLWAVNLWEL